MSIRLDGVLLVALYTFFSFFLARTQSPCQPELDRMKAVSGEKKLSEKPTERY